MANHDPHDGKNSLVLVLGILVLAIVGIVGFTSTRDRPNPVKGIGVAFEVDGCKVYSFRDNDGTHYFARCPNTERVATTYRTDKHIITE